MVGTIGFVTAGDLPVDLPGMSNIGLTAPIVPTPQVIPIDKAGTSVNAGSNPGSAQEAAPVAPTKELAEKATVVSTPSLPAQAAEASVESQPSAETAGTQVGTPEVEEMKSIDTIDLEQPEGNWLNKRIWWERAKDKYKECRELFEAIFSSRMGFLEKRSEIEKTIFDPFYRQIGLEQAELRDLLTSLIDYVEEEKEEAGYLDDQARQLRDKISAAKKDIEQLKLDIDAINNIDNAIDKAVNTLSAKINEAHRFEQAAWDEFEAIAHELSDKRAYERYYVIDGIHKNLKDLQKYILEEFNTYFNGLVKAAYDKTERAKKEVQGLKDQDIDLQDQAKRLASEEQLSEEEEAKRAEKAAEEARKAAQAAKVGFFGHIWAWTVNVLKGLWNLLFGWWLYRL
jgi:hypothetical protein